MRNEEQNNVTSGRHLPTFCDAVLEAVNLGDDADTTGAVCGRIAGAFYGESDIPAEWRRQLVMSEQIGEWAESPENAN